MNNFFVSASSDLLCRFRTPHSGLRARWGTIRICCK